MFDFDMDLCYEAQASKFTTMGQTLDKLEKAHAVYHTFLGQF